MSFCSNCGKPLQDGVKFCANCGAQVGSIQEPAPESNTERKQTFEGEIKKCPSCGAILPSMSAKCPECGFELRAVKASSTLQKFYQDLKDGDDYEDVETITNFPIPNSREDLNEFLVFCGSELTILPSQDQITGIYDEKRNAWKKKLVQVEMKSKLVFGESSAEYIQISGEIKKIRETFSQNDKIVSKAVRINNKKMDSKKKENQKYELKKIRTNAKVPQTDGYEEKSRLVALILCMFGGWLGLHNYYVGRIGKGILYTCTFGLIYIGWGIDFLLILAGRFTDKNGVRLEKW